jgi:hypothetical protein
MARDPNIKVGVDTDEAVRNLGNLEEAAVDAENKVEKLDEQTVSIDTRATTKALQDVADKLDKTSAAAKSAGRDGIPVTTTAFRDLTEGIGGPASGAIGSAFAFGESIEGLGDLVEGFGGQLGLNEVQIGKVTSALGTALGVLGAVGVAFTVGKAAYDLFSAGAKNAAKEQAKFNADVEAAQKELTGLSDLLAKNEKEEAYRQILGTITDELGLLTDAGAKASDVIVAIADGNRDLIKQYEKEADALNELGEQLEFDTEARYARNEITDDEYDAALKQVDAYDLQADKLRLVAERLNVWITAGEQEADTAAIIREALGELNTTTAKYEEETRKATEAAIDFLGVHRQFEGTLDDVEEAVNGYREVLRDTPNDLEAVDDAARNTADSVINMAEDFGELEGAAKGSEDWKNRTTAAIAFVAGTLAPDDPLRARLNAYVAEIAKVPTAVNTRFSNSVDPVTLPRSGGSADVLERRAGNTTVNVTVTSADPNAVVRAIQTYVRQNGRIPGIG